MDTETAKSIDKRLYTIHPSRKLQVSKDEYTLSHFHENLAYRYATQRNDTDPGKLLESMKERYLWYRKSWRGLPREAIKQQIGGDYVNQFNTVVRRVALVHYPQANAASLDGASWVDFIRQKGESSLMSDDIATALQFGRFQTKCDVDVDAMQGFGQQWIQSLYIGDKKPNEDSSNETASASRGLSSDA